MSKAQCDSTLIQETVSVLPFYEDVRIVRPPIIARKAYMERAASIKNMERRDSGRANVHAIGYRFVKEIIIDIPSDRKSRVGESDNIRAASLICDRCGNGGLLLFQSTVMKLIAVHAEVSVAIPSGKSSYDSGKHRHADGQTFVFRHNDEI